MIMPTDPVLAGERIALRPLRADDWDVLFAVARDLLIWAGHPSHDRWQESIFRAFFDEALASSGALLVSDTATDRAIGSSRYDFEHAREDEVEIGWTFLARAYWGGTTNREMKRLMLAHAFGFVDRVIFRIGEGNVRSRTAIERIGAVLTDRSQVEMRVGREVVHLVYSIDRDAFARGPLNA